MYTPKYFQVSDREEVCAFIEKNGFGQLISKVNGRLFSTHMPFTLSADKSRLYGHLAKNNPQHLELEGQELLISIQGPHDYISPTWYASPGVPTWNYQSLSLYGQGRIFSDVVKLKGVVDSLARKYESGLTPPWEPEYNMTMLDAIVGIDIEISDIHCTYKLSQNRPAEDRANVIAELKARGSNALAAEMERCK